MRDIKFRGYHMGNGGWLYGYYIKHEIRQIYPIGDALAVNEIKYYIVCDGFADWNMPRDLDFREVAPETVGQYTGVKDTKKKEIYDGDILRIICEDCDYDYITSVFSVGITLCVDVEGEDYDYTPLEFAIDVWDNYGTSYEIIGNIHDNPELIKGE